MRREVRLKVHYNFQSLITRRIALLYRSRDPVSELFNCAFVIYFDSSTTCPYSYAIHIETEVCAMQNKDERLPQFPATVSIYKLQI